MILGALSRAGKPLLSRPGMRTRTTRGTTGVRPVEIEPVPVHCMKCHRPATIAVLDMCACGGFQFRPDDWVGDSGCVATGCKAPTYGPGVALSTRLLCWPHRQQHEQYAAYVRGIHSMAAQAANRVSILRYAAIAKASCRDCRGVVVREPSRLVDGKVTPDTMRRVRCESCTQRRAKAASSAASTRRRARKARVPHTPYSRAEIFAAYGGTCAYCDAPAEHLDHVVAISRGGADAAHNLLPACAPCNLSKSAKSLAEWAATF
jgi:5-methylcytosine-specific restriction endonuclease McrA